MENRLNVLPLALGIVISALIFGGFGYSLGKGDIITLSSSGTFMSDTLTSKSTGANGSDDLAKLEQHDGLGLMETNKHILNSLKKVYPNIALISAAKSSSHSDQDNYPIYGEKGILVYSTAANDSTSQITSSDIELMRKSLAEEKFDSSDSSSSLNRYDVDEALITSGVIRFRESGSSNIKFLLVPDDINSKGSHNLTVLVY